MSKGWILAVVAYAVLTLLCAAATTGTVFTGIARLNLLGNAVEVRLAECHREDGTRGTTRTACSGPSQNTTNARTIEVTYDGQRGETIRAAQKPWGSYEAVDTGFVSWGIAVLLPLLPLGATAATGALAIREVRRATQPDSSGRAT
ncbi:hypothetical protein ACF1BN_20740 [Streptomyces sp. NPDC014861]|uniref:hypothetical protein n=1 Tax=Streptomyces sp. NPDC014861 TaxID=3364923 RepID=UPI0036FAAD25